MKTGLVVYRSRTGTTRRFAEEIGKRLTARGLAVTVTSISDCDPATLADADFVLLGCWTDGLMIVGQGPDQPWRAFARRVPSMGDARVGLFTTYRIVTGSMFGRMRRELRGKAAAIDLELKSRDGQLSKQNELDLDRFVEAA